MHQPFFAVDAFRTIPYGAAISWTYSAGWLSGLIPDGYHLWEMYWEGREWGLMTAHYYTNDYSTDKMR